MRDSGVSIESLVVDEKPVDDVAAHFQKRYGIDDTGAVLVRPDGFIGWRSAQLESEPTRILDGVLRQILHR